MTAREQQAAAELAEALAEALRVLDEDGRAALEDYLSAHPEKEPELRQRLQLLADSGMLDEGEAATDGEVPGRLGEFVLGKKLGSGGMGVVYRAFQPSLGRNVALKLIRPEHLYFPQARERFRREVEAVARLEHAGIVRVYAADEEAGVPFFVMERVEGLSLDRLLVLLRERELRTLNERTVRAVVCDALGQAGAEVNGPPGRRWGELCCRWLCDLALAVDHAHRHGVLHRDLKPSNVMVTPALEVKLLDFGLANTRESASITRSGAQLGSVPYMAPEQLAGEVDAIDERTDVYGLGVTMHELLVLQSAFLRDGESEEQTRRRILDGAAPSIRSRNPAVSWDAETVCTVAMDPDPQRRYQSAAELASDLHNVLELRSIAGRRSGPVRRLRRWAQRRPGWAVGIALGSLLLVVGPTAFAIRERVVRAQISQAKQDAEAELDTQLEILRFLNEDLLGGMAPDEVGREASMREVLDVAAARIEGRFPDRPHVEAALRRTIGETYYTLGELGKGEVHLLRAVALYDSCRGPEHEHTLRARRNLAALYRRDDRLTEAEAIGRQVMETLVASGGPEDLDTLKAKNSLGLTLTRLGRYDEAEALLSEVVEGRLRRLGEIHKSTAEAMCNLGLVYFRSGRPRLAEPWWRRELAITRSVFAGKDHPDLLVSLANWANLQDTLGASEETLVLREELIERNAAVHGPNHPETILAALNLGVALSNMGRNEQAERRLQDALARCGDLPVDHRHVLDVRLALARVLASTGRSTEGVAEVDEVLRIHRAASEPNPGRIVRSEHIRAMVLIAGESWEEAEEQCRRALDLCRSGGFGGTRLADIHVLRGQCLHHLTRYAEAVDALVRADELLTECAPRHRYVGKARRALVEVYEAWAKPVEAARWRAAVRQWQEATGGADRD